MHNLRKKKILITAGPTWVAIDNVRVISNTATGQTGILLASKLVELGAKVTLILGPVGKPCCFNKKIKVIPYRFFEEFKKYFFNELKRHRYDALIHTAAVSDYKPSRRFGYKIKSDARKLEIRLIPTQKLIDAVKKINRRVFAVGFKFGPGLSKASLVRQARRLLWRANLDLVVANKITKGTYYACIVGPQKLYHGLKNRGELSNTLIRLIGERI